MMDDERPISENGKTNISYHIPKNWKKISIKDIAEVKGGKRLPSGHILSNDKTLHPYIRVIDFKNMGVDTNNLKYLSSETYSSIKRYTISSKDVYVSIAGTIGLVGLIPPEVDGANLTENAAKLTGLKDVENIFLAYSLSSSISQKQISNLTGTGAQPKLALFRLESIELLLPPLPEQHKIASILSKVDEHISHTEAIIEKTEELKKGLMQQLLTKGIGHTKFKKTEIGEIPEEWDVKEIHEICEVKTGGTPSTKRKEYWNGDILWMSSGEINNHFIYTTEKRITVEGMNNSNARILPANSVMIALNGQGKTRGTVAVLKVPSTCNQSLACIIPDGKACDYLYLYYNLQSRYLEIRNYTGNTGREGLNLGIIRDVNVPLPTLSEQHKIASILYGVDDQLSQNQTYLSHLQELKKGLMQDLLTGKVRVKIGTYH